MKGTDLREQLIDNPQIKNSILKTASSKAKNIITHFRACDSAVKVVGLVEGFDKVISKLDENVADAAKTNAVAICPDLRRRDVCP